ncbi:hypothetical protein GFD17_08745 [Bifidobacterium sp. SMB2]|uniref:Permease n=1 Tax=Bifidobacterium saimiriisciurei TaxID=2661627 RepID=A0ABX0CIW0_9BIFI|nr:MULTISPECIES: DUF6350 family protein [Bifidobacterium]NEG96836.1 hypothetical protein [Bifidobacterium sp. SMB2]NEH12305.1 hypothetical protein [Bifidobacterium saimiriisciurei]
MGSAALSLAVYVIALACFNALMLLIISMEEGGQGLTGYTMDFTKSVVLLSQGVGLQFQSIHLTIIPLGLTMLLIALVRSVTARFGCSLLGYLGGTTCWLALNAWLAGTVNITLVDSLGVIMAKGLLIYSLAYVLAWFPHSKAKSALAHRFHAMVGEDLRMALRSGMLLTLISLASLTLIGAVTVISWSVMNADAVSRMFSLTGMATGSAVMTTIACLIWLPNCMVWAMSWLCGAGFSVGSLATFSMWTGQAHDLPSVPVFGIFPEPVDNAGIRMLLMSLPGLIALACAFWQLLSKRRFQVLHQEEGETSLVSMRTIRRFGLPALSFCMVCSIICIVVAVVSAVSGGSLGVDRLSRVGADPAATTQAVARPIAVGLLAAWLMALIIVSLRFAFFQIRSGAAKREQTRQDKTDATAGEKDSDTSAATETRTSRTISSEAIQPTTKEDK